MGHSSAPSQHHPIIFEVQVSFMVLSTFASQLANGSPVIVGVFRGVKVEEFPAHLDPFFVALEIEADPHEVGHQIFELRLIDEDGAVLYDNQIGTDFQARPGFLPSYMYFCGQVFLNRPIPRPGVYRFDLEWQGRTLAQVRLEVTL